MPIELTEDEFGLHAGEITDPVTGKTVFLTVIPTDEGWWVYVGGDRLPGSFSSKQLAAQAADKHVNRRKVSGTTVLTRPHKPIAERPKAVSRNKTLPRVAAMALLLFLVPTATIITYAALPGDAEVIDHALLPSDTRTQAHAQLVPVPQRKPAKLTGAKQSRAAKSLGTSGFKKEVGFRIPTEKPKLPLQSGEQIKQNSVLVSSQRVLEHAAYVKLPEAPRALEPEEVSPATTNVIPVPVKVKRSNADNGSTSRNSKATKYASVHRNPKIKTVARSRSKLSRRDIRKRQKKRVAKRVARKRTVVRKKRRVVRTKRRLASRSIVLSKRVVRMRSGRRIVRLKIRRPRNKREFRQFQKLRNKVIASQLRARRRIRRQ